MWTVHQLLTRRKFGHLKQTIEKLSQVTDGSHGFKYTWPAQTPNESGDFFPDSQTSNCATFPAAERILGVPVPEHSGNMRE